MLPVTCFCCIDMLFLVVVAVVVSLVVVVIGDFKGSLVAIVSSGCLSFG